MPSLREKDTGRLLGSISDSDLQFLIDQFEEESSDDRDYYVDEDTLAMLEEEGAPAGLITLLRTAIAGQSEGLEIAWTPD
jgi:hypothetical protein